MRSFAHIRWIVCVCFFLVVPACAEDFGGEMSAAALPVRSELSVATLNMYLGFDLSPVVDGSIDTSDKNQIRNLISSFYGLYSGNLPHERIRTMAANLAQSAPDVIGVQEGVYLSLNGMVFGDYVHSLTREIRKAGGPEYKVITLNTTSFSGAIDTGVLPIAVDFKDREAILYRDNLNCAPIDSGKVYSHARTPVTVMGRAVSLVRGVLSASCKTADGKSFYLFDTHLDVSGEQAAQEAQAHELLAYVKNIAQEGTPVIVTGDFNASEDGMRTHTYSILTSNGFTDSFREKFPDVKKNPGYTCCQADNLDNKFSLAGTRYDYVFHLGAGLSVEDVHIFDDSAVPRIDGTGTLWPSDHFGVVTKFKWK